MSDQNILREYLISLGFKVNEKQNKQFDKTVSDTDKRMMLLGKSISGVAVAAQAMVTEFAFRMERLYYASRLAESTADNLQALDFGGKQAGIKDFTANVQQLARSIRANPGLNGLLNSLGVAVQGRDKADVLLDLVKSLKSMPFYIAQRYASMFGIDPDQLLLMQEGLGVMERAAQLRRDAAKGMGVDTEEAVKAGKEYAQTWREILMYAGLFRDAVSIQMLPAMQELANVTKNVLTDWARIVKSPPPDWARELMTGLGMRSAGGGVTLNDQAKARLMAGGDAGAVGKVKTWSEMTVDERRGRGMSLYSPNWNELTPDERKSRGMPATKEEFPWYSRAADKINSWFNNAGVSYGLDSAGGGVELSSQSKERLGLDRLAPSNYESLGLGGRIGEALRNGFGYKTLPKTGIDAAAIEAATAPDPKLLGRDQPAIQSGSELFDRNEKRTGLPPGFLNYIWNKEGRVTDGTKNKQSGATGPFQFMPGTMPQYGLNEQSAGTMSESTRAAADYLHDLSRKYGDMRFAAAAYNWGPGKLDKLMAKTMAEHGDMSQDEQDRYVLGHLPAETRKYISGLDANGVAGSGGGQVEIKADTTINISNSTSPADAARLVDETLKNTFSDIQRNMGAKLR